MSDGEGSAVTLSVLICTYRRPEMLRSLLDRIAQISSASTDHSISCVVVDDDPLGSALQSVEAARTDSDLSVEYLGLGSQDIAAARNAAIEVGTGMADWVVCIDDDCVPELDWIQQLVVVQRATGADIVTSGVRYFMPPGAPQWIAEQGFLSLVNEYEDESVPEFGCMANAMIRSAWLRTHPNVRFDATFGKTGGEDMIFLRTATNNGAAMRWASLAHVSEGLTADRASLKYLVFRRYWLGNNNIMIHLRGGWNGRARLALRVARKLVNWIRDLVLDPLRRRPFHARARLARLAEIIGMALGLVGIEAKHR